MYGLDLMNILITGGCGFLGSRLARALLHVDGFELLGSPARAVSQVTLTDRVPPPPDVEGNARVRFLRGDLLELLCGGGLTTGEFDLVFHLAAAVSAECEADFDLGMRSNLDATRHLLEDARRAGHAPVFVFSSSVAVFGSAPTQPLPETVEDATLPTPQHSYGFQKFMGEQLVADYSRKGFVHGRSVRLMTVAVRPGRPNGAASGFLSGILREPLAGERARCPVSEDTAIALASPSSTVAGLMRAATARHGEWGGFTAVNLPGVTTTVGEMVGALGRLAGTRATELIDWVPDAAIAGIVTSWPSRFLASRAAALGLRPDASFDVILREYVREFPEAVKIPLEG